MLWPPDYHMHTPLCRHAQGEPVEYAARAVALGLSEIGFSDHNPMRQDDFDNWRMRLADLDSYVSKVEEARKRFPELTIKLGMEVDYIPGYEPWIGDLAARYPWDYFIGSVHYVEGWAIDDPATIPQWRSRDVYEVWAKYCQILEEAATSGLFEILGHADLCKKFGFYPERDWWDLFVPVMAAASKSGTAIELNTAGLRKDCRSIYPDARILKLAFEHGVAITFGSDAHAPGEVGLNFQEAVQLARSVGFKEYRVLGNRRAEAKSFE